MLSKSDETTPTNFDTKQRKSFYAILNRLPSVKEQQFSPKKSVLNSKISPTPGALGQKIVPNMVSEPLKSPK